MRKSILWIAAIPVALSGAGAFADTPRDYAARQNQLQERRNHEPLADANEQISEATKVVAQMRSDPAIQSLLKTAKGVLILPDYGRGALIVGGSGGSGVLMARNNGAWTGPALYNVGTVSIGAQAGASGGSAAMLLMTDKVINRFERDNSFSLNADAGLTIVHYTKHANKPLTGGDVILWTNTTGAYAGASIGLTNVNFDEKETGAYYGHAVTARSILSGTERNAQADMLMKALPG